MANACESELDKLLTIALVPAISPRDQALYRIENDLITLIELDTATDIWKRFYGRAPGDEFAHVWLARIGSIARNLRPFVPRTIH